MLKDLKITYSVYNFFHPGKLKHNNAAFKKYGIRKRYFSSLSSSDFPANKIEDITTNPEKFAKAIEHDTFYNTLSQAEKEKINTWPQKGYVALEGFFDNDTVDAINREVDALIAQKKANFRYGSKIMFAIKQSALLRNLAQNPKLKNTLRLLMQNDAMLFQSINFLKGSEQKTHSDSIHMSSYPLGNLIAAWVALEDVDESNGTLHYYEGSHLLPYYMNKDFGNEGTKWRLGKKTYHDYEKLIEEKIKEHKLTKSIFRAKKGDVFIWHANLLHGGEPHVDKSKTRKSVVFHYFGKGAICYHEVTQRPALIDTY